MARIDDARVERKLLLDLRESEGWKMYEAVLRERIQLRINDIAQPPVADQAPNLKEFISGEINGLIQAKDTLFERWIESLSEEISQLGGDEETEDGSGRDGEESGSDPLGFGISER